MNLSIFTVFLKIETLLQKVTDYAALKCLLIFISRINTKSEGFQVKTIFSFQNFSFYELIKFHAQLS